MGYLRVTVSDGTGLSVFEAGHGGRPLLLVHGNSCDHTFLAPQVDHFAPMRRVIAPDLRGHGASEKPEGDYTLARLAQDLAEVLAALDTGPVVAVGHSMGGLAALELAVRHPDAVAAVVCLDSGLLVPHGRPSRVHALAEGLRSPEWKSYFLRHFEAAFEPTDDPARKKAILERMMGTPRHVMASLFEQQRQGDAQAALRLLRAPLLCVGAARARTDVARLLELCPQAVTGQTVGSGHFMTLEVPEQVNAMLERFLKVTGL